MSSKIDLEKLFQNKSILITGVCGTVGGEILRQLVKYNVKNIIGLDINENEIFLLSNEYKDDERVSIYYGSLRKKESLAERMRGVDIVLHTAALKHVGVCEDSPRDAVLTNINGTNNLIDIAVEAKVKRMLFTSSDKAVNPTNVMGTSKLMGERLMTAATGNGKDDKPILASTRFGNVLGSRGSVVPIFRQQIVQGGPITLTDKDMTRFIMTLQEAVHLVLKSVFLASGGEVFVTKMPVVRIEDLALAMIDLLAARYGFDDKNIPIEITGLRPAEKMYEELFNDEETRRTFEIDDYYVIAPALKTVPNTVNTNFNDGGIALSKNPYNSSLVTPMSIDEIKEYLVNRNILD
jgi:FlaA1/EpsC-like NDP-sugar epimerase